MKTMNQLKNEQIQKTYFEDAKSYAEMIYNYRITEETDECIFRFKHATAVLKKPALKRLLTYCKHLNQNTLVRYIENKINN